MNSEASPLSRPWNVGRTLLGIAVGVAIGVAAIGAVQWLFPATTPAPAPRKEIRPDGPAVEHPAEGQSPVVSADDAERITDRDLAFSFELPDGFQPFPPESVLPGYRSCYSGEADEGSPAPVLLIKDLREPLPPKHVSETWVPPGKGITLQTFNWRGLTLDGMRVPEDANGAPYVTFNVRIPLRKRAIQMSFGDAGANEPALRQRVESTLATLQGETNW